MNVKEKVKAIVCLGVDNKKIKKATSKLFLPDSTKQR